VSSAHLRRPVTVPGRLAVVLGLYVAAALVPGLLTFARLRGGWSVGAALMAWAGAFLISLWLVPVAGSGWSVVGATLAGLVFVLTASESVHATTLELRGVTVYSTVIDVSSVESRASIAHVYKLADPAGHQIAGHLSETGDLLSGHRPVGDRVLVVADPDGLVDPETPGQLAGARLAWIANGVSFVVTAFMALWTARSGPGMKRRLDCGLLDGRG
jgi:hypothetical protein